MNNYQRIAASMLKFRKANWDKARAADPEQMNAWAAIFQAAQVSYPDIVWQHAMLHLGKTMDEPPTAKDVLAGCRHVVATAGVGSEVAVALDAHRSARLKARETSGTLPPGTTFSTPQTANEPRKRGTGAPPPEAKARMEAWRKKPRPKKLTPAERGDQSRQALNRLDQLTFQTIENVQKRQTQQAKEAQK